MSISQLLVAIYTAVPTLAAAIVYFSIYDLQNNNKIDV